MAPAPPERAAAVDVPCAGRDGGVLGASRRIVQRAARHDPRRHRRQWRRQDDAAQDSCAGHGSDDRTRGGRRACGLAPRDRRGLRRRSAGARERADERGDARALAERGAPAAGRDPQVRRGGAVCRDPAQALLERHVPAAGVLVGDQHGARHPPRRRDPVGRRPGLSGALSGEGGGGRPPRSHGTVRLARHGRHRARVQPGHVDQPGANYPGRRPRGGRRRVPRRDLGAPPTPRSRSAVAGQIASRRSRRSGCCRPTAGRSTARPPSRTSSFGSCSRRTIAS